MNYKLGIVGRKSVRQLDLTQVIQVDNIKHLEFLDKFTMNFKNEPELMIYLFNKDMITPKEATQKLKVTYIYNKESKKLPIMYKGQEKYLDEFYLHSKLLMLSKDLEFLEKLANHYSIGSSKYNLQGINVSDIKRYISDVRSNGGNTFESASLNFALNDLLIKAVQRVNLNTGEATTNYRGLRDLGLFIYSYEIQKGPKSLDPGQENNCQNEEGNYQLTFRDFMRN